jgi:hypothetical protein
MSDIEDRLDRLESLVEQQQEVIEDQRERITELRDELDDKPGHEEADDAEPPSVNRRTALKAGGLLAAVGLGASTTAGTATADPSGQIGTASDPLEALYTEELYGNGGTLTVQDTLDLDGNNLTSRSVGSEFSMDVDSGATNEDKQFNVLINDTQNSASTIEWRRMAATEVALRVHDRTFDTALLSVNDGGEIDVHSGNLDLNSNTVTNVSSLDGGGTAISLGDTVDLDGNTLTDSGDLTIQSGSDSSLTLRTNGGDRGLELGVPTTHGSNEAGGNFVAGHPNNSVTDGLGVVIGGGGRAGGDENTVDANYTTVGGGFNNAASAKRATVGGGKNNEASGGDATVGGGRGNAATDGASTVSGGRGNTASQTTATVSGGGFNTAGGRGSSVPGGRWGRAVDRLSFVWNDGTFYGSTDGLSSSEQVDGEPVTGSNTFSVSANSGVRFITGGSENPNVTYIDSSGAFVSSGNVVASNTVDAQGGTVENSSGSLTLATSSGNLMLNPSGNVDLSGNNLDLDGGRFLNLRARDNIPVYPGEFAIDTDSSEILFNGDDLYSWAADTVSSARYKENIEPWSADPYGALDLEAKEYDLLVGPYGGDGPTQIGEYGFLAEKAEECAPWVVQYAEITEDNKDDLRASDEHVGEYVPNRIDYDKFTIAHNEILADHDEELNDIHADLDQKQACIDELEAELQRKDRRIDQLEDETRSLREENEQLRERNAELESRLDRIETHLGIDAAGQHGVADD